MDPRVQFRHLRTFVEVARHRSFTRAAEALNTVQPAVSRTVAHLEQIIGKPLFERRAKGLTPTSAGETLMLFAEPGLTQIAEGIQQAAGRGDTQTMSLGVLPNVTREVMPAAVLRFKRAHPNVTVRIVTGSAAELLRLLHGGEVDMLVGRLLQPELVKGLSFDHRYDEPLVFAAWAGHPLARRRRVTPEDVERFGIVLPSTGSIIRDEVNRFAMAQGRPAFSNVLETTSFEFARPYIAGSDAVIVFPQGTMRAELRKGSWCACHLAMTVSVGRSASPIFRADP
jgi:LysR family pca operon transcriptional activator